MVHQEGNELLSKVSVSTDIELFRGHKRSGRPLGGAGTIHKNLIRF